jgi:type VI protein secretion system component VasK
MGMSRSNRAASFSTNEGPWALERLVRGVGSAFVNGRDG